MAFGNGGTLGSVGSGGSGMNAMTASAIGLPQMFDEQTQKITALHEAITELDKRLTLLLAPLPQTGASEKQGPTSPQYLSRMQDHNNGIGSAIQRVASIIERLQL